MATKHILASGLTLTVFRRMDRAYKTLVLTFCQQTLREVPKKARSRDVSLKKNVTFGMQANALFLTLLERANTLCELQSRSGMFSPHFLLYRVSISLSTSMSTKKRLSSFFADAFPGQLIDRRHHDKLPTFRVLPLLMICFPRVWLQLRCATLVFSVQCDARLGGQQYCWNKQACTLRWALGAKSEVMDYVQLAIVLLHV